MCEGLEHRGPLFGFIAPAATVSIALGMQPPQGEQLVDLCESVFLGGPCLIEPECAECIEGICIQVGKCFPLLPEALRPRRTFFRWQVGLGIKEKRAELGRTTSHVGGQEGRGPGDAVEALERIQGKGLPQGLIGRCTQDGQMLILQQWGETDPRGHGVSESEQVFEFHQGGSSGLNGRRPIEGDVLGDTRQVLAHAVTEGSAVRCAGRVEDGCLKHGVWHGGERSFAALLGEGLKRPSGEVGGEPPRHRGPAARLITGRELMDESRTHGVDDSGIQRQLDKRPCVGRDHL